MKTGLAQIVLVAFALLASRPSLAVGEDTGRIIGTVTEASSGTPLGGATIVVKGPALLGAPRQTISAEDGRFEVRNLRPGTYDVEVSLTGPNPVVHRVLVRATEATPVTIAWSAEMTGEAVEIIAEERHMTRPDSSMTGSTFTMDKQNNLPIARQYQSVVTQTPGVTVNVGGNPSVKGANSRNNRVLVDGLDTTDPFSNTFSANVNQDSLAAVQVITGGFEAKYNALGGIQNLITNSGSDEFHFDVAFYTQSRLTQDFFLAGNNVYNGPRPFSEAQKPPSARYSTAFNINGPIVKRQLWYSLGLEWGRDSTVAPAAAPLNQQAPNRVFQNWYPRLKLTWLPNVKNKIMLEGLGDPTTIDYSANGPGPAGPVGAEANTTHPLAAFAQNQGGWKGIAEWDYFITPDIDTKIFGGYSWSLIDNGPQGLVRGGQAGYDPDRAGHLNRDDGTRWLNREQYRQTRRYRFQLDGALSARGQVAGPHEAEAGFQSSFLAFRERKVFTGGGHFYTDQAGGPLASGLCDADPGFGVQSPTGNGCFLRADRQDTLQRQRGYTFGVYLQDRWKPLRWLTLVPGLRYDVSRAYIVDGGDAILVRGWGPRFSSIFDLTDDQKTILQLGYGHTTEMAYLDPLNKVEATRKSVTTTSRWDPASKSFGSPSVSGGPGGVAVDQNAHVPPHSDEILASIRRELFGNSVGTVEYTYKRLSNIIEFVETNAIFDPSGNRIVGYVDGDPRSKLLLTFPPENKAYYSGFDFIFEARPTPNLDVLASYTLSWTWGPGYADNNTGGPTADLGDPANRFSQFANPRQAQFAYGYAPGIDTRHNLKTATTYSFHGATIGATINWRSGIAQLRQFFGPGSVPPRWRTPNGLEPGSNTNDVKSWTEVRTPDLFTVDLALTYDFFQLTRQHFVAQATIFNLFDASTPTELATRETAPPSRFGQVTTRVMPFRMQLGLRYQY